MSSLASTGVWPPEITWFGSYGAWISGGCLWSYNRCWYQCCSSRWFSTKRSIWLYTTGFVNNIASAHDLAPWSVSVGSQNELLCWWSCTKWCICGHISSVYISIAAADHLRFNAHFPKQYSAITCVVFGSWTCFIFCAEIYLLKSGWWYIVIMLTNIFFII